MRRAHEAKMLGALESAFVYGVDGWAWNPADPDRPVEVSVTLDGELIATGSAVFHRHDLLVSGHGNGQCGFAIRFAQPLETSSLDRVRCIASTAGGPVPLPVVLRAPSPRPIRLLTAPVGSDHEPVFVLGSPRSGTSAMCLALRRIPRYVGFVEGHVLDLVVPLADAIRTFYESADLQRAIRSPGTFVGAVDPHYFEHAVKGMFSKLMHDTFDGNPYWVDKVGMGIAAAPILREIWPASRFIFMKRRGYENVSSRMRKFEGYPFERNCADWAGTMEAWRDIRNRLAGVAIEVDQIAMAREPSRVADVLASFLSLTPGESELLAHSFSLERPEQTSTDASAALDPNALAWSTDQMATFKAACGAMMQAYEYGDGARYFSSDGQSAIRSI